MRGCDVCGVACAPHPASLDRNSYLCARCAKTTMNDPCEFAVPDEDHEGEHVHCHDGYLYGTHPDNAGGDTPCPRCNTEEFVPWAAGIFKLKGVVDFRYRDEGVGLQSDETHDELNEAEMKVLHTAWQEGYVEALLEEHEVGDWMWVKPNTGGWQPMMLLRVSPADSQHIYFATARMGAREFSMVHCEKIGPAIRLGDVEDLRFGFRELLSMMEDVIEVLQPDSGRKITGELLRAWQDKLAELMPDIPFVLSEEGEEDE